MIRPTLGISNPALRCVLLILLVAGTLCFLANFRLPITRNGLGYAKTSLGIIQHHFNPLPLVHDMSWTSSKPIFFSTFAAPLVRLFGVNTGIIAASFIGTVFFVWTAALAVQRMILRAGFDTRIAPLALILAIFNPLCIYQFWSGYPDGFMGAFVMLAFLLTDTIAVEPERDTRRHIVALGLLIYIAIHTKLYGAILGLTCTVYLLMHGRQLLAQSTRRSWKLAIYCIVFGALAMVLILAKMGINPLLDFAAENSFGGYRAYTSSLFNLNKHVLLATFSLIGFTFLLNFHVSLFSLATRAAWRAWRPALAVFVALYVLGLVTVGGTAYNMQYFLPVFPVLGVALAAGIRAMPTVVRRLLLVAYGAVALMLVLNYNYAPAERVLQPIIGRLLPRTGTIGWMLDNLRLPDHVALKRQIDAINKNVPSGSVFYCVSHIGTHGVPERLGMKRRMTVRYTTSSAEIPQPPTPVYISEFPSHTPSVSLPKLPSWANIRRFEYGLFRLDPIQVTLIPGSGDHVAANEPVKLQVQVVAGKGMQVVRVDFLEGGTVVGSAFAPPFELDWKDVAPGHHEIVVIVNYTDAGTVVDTLITRPVIVTVDTPVLERIIRKAGGPAAFKEEVMETFAPGIVTLPAKQWKERPMAGMSGGSVLSSETPGAALEFDFDGTAVSADMVVGKRSGMFSVSIDSKPLETVDLFKNLVEEDSERVVLANNLVSGKHKLRLNVLKTRNPEGIGSLIAVDTLRVANMPYGEISGILECRYNAGMPVMRALVEAKSENGSLNFITGENGTFSVQALAPGKYTMHITHRGFATVEKKDLAVVSGKKLILSKIFLEEHAGARPLTFIRDPLGVRPVIVRPGDEFPLEVAAPASASGWRATLKSPWAESKLVLKNAVFHSGKGRWMMKAGVPAGVSSFLYGLRLKFKGGADFQPRAVMVVPRFKDSIRVVQLTDVHVYKTVNSFDVYRKLAEAINLINPDIVVVTGDVTNTNGYTDGRWPESDEFPPMLDLWNSYNSPTFVVAGNHDLSPFNKENAHQRWIKFFDKIEYSFDVGRFHFTTFDNAFTMATKEKPFRDELFPEQLKWLEKDLSANSGAGMRILLHHVPLDKTEVLNLASKYNVKLALSGHVHQDHVYKVKSTTFMQTAAAFEGGFRVVNLDKGEIDQADAGKDGYGALSIDALKAGVLKSGDGRNVTLKVNNSSARAFPGASLRTEMPPARDYSCVGCTVTSRFGRNGKTLVIIAFDIPAIGESTAVLSAK